MVHAIALKGEIVMDKSNIAYVGENEITVQALRVNGKKMTLQFFRQMPSAPYFTEAVQVDLSFVPWGRVNYAVTKEGSSWLVTQKGPSLFRCCIDPPSTSEWSIDYHTKGIKDAEEKISQSSSNSILMKMYEDNHARHTAGLRDAIESLRIARIKVAILSKLNELPQLYLA